MKFKRGEMTTQQIIVMIILITSFVIVLFFLFRLNLGQESQDQICHNSVLQKASVLSEAPLQCYRSYVCITEDGSCEELIDPERKRVDSLEEVYEVLADEMADCWWMFGQGKVNYVGDEFTKNNYCSICSQIYFDDSLENIEGIEDNKISKDGLYDYLTKNEYSEGETYVNYMNLPNPQALRDEAQKLNNEVTFGNIELEGQYLVVTGIISEVSTWKVVAAGVVAGAVLAPVIAGASLGVIIFGGTAGAAAGVGGAEVSELFEPEIGAIVVEGDGIENRFMAPTIQEARSDKFNSLNCEEILTFT